MAKIWNIPAKIFEIMRYVFGISGGEWLIMVILIYITLHRLVPFFPISL